MTNIIELIDSRTNQSVKKIIHNGTYKESEEKCKELNSKLDKSKEYKFWKITIINFN